MTKKGKEMKASEALEVIKGLAERHLEEHKPEFDEFVGIMVAMISVANTIDYFKRNGN